ncbi:glutaredoxin family protein [Pseudarthrobacter sp. J1738]|uniref:glutaredoxin family protein n=1 Tax=Pseudarthrobacter sp. J1738 TaxID=3420446 RepID=UPI003D2C2F79
MHIPELVLVTKSQCHLCDAARETVASVAADAGIAWAEQLIDDDDTLRARFAEEVPVVLVDGVQRDFWKIDPVRLRKTLDKAMSQAD